MGYTRKDRMMNGMWSKSSKQFADRIETKVLKLGFGIGASLLSGGSTSSGTRPRRKSSSIYPLPVDPNSPALCTSTKSAIIACAVFLIVAPISLALGFVSYGYWGFWAFFSLLIFSTIALFSIGFTFVMAAEPKDLKRKVYKIIVIAAVVEGVLFLIGNLWPIFVRDSEISTFTYLLMAIQEFALLAGCIPLISESKILLNKEK